ncbi:HNH endonuclease [Planctomicrobium sp. SH668]|uniref:HNH endonuclease n=1 Tax=Planctomicrobium sp. SH668 TaxID=3448126 RepID=UPI003F5B6815
MIRIDELTPHEVELQRMRSTLRTRLRQKAKESHEGKVPCSYCGRELNNAATMLSHLQAPSRGGATTEFNVVLACRNCVDSKRDKTLNEWCQHLMVQQGEVMRLMGSMHSRESATASAQ